MNAYKCSKCGETMITKDIVNRNHFCTDQTAAIMTNITNVITTVKDNGKRMVTIEFPFTDNDDSWENDRLEWECVKMLRELPEETVRHWLCDHKWTLDDERKQIMEGA